MPEGIAMRRCAQCGHVVFPPRALCPSCGAMDWKRALAMAGTVQEVTRRRPRRKRKQTPLGDWIERSDIQLAEVRTDLGPVVTVLAPDGDLEPGMQVALESEASVTIARESAELRAHKGDPARPGGELEGEALPGEWFAPSDPEPSDRDELVPGEWSPDEERPTASNPEADTGS